MKRAILAIVLSLSASANTPEYITLIEHDAVGRTRTAMAVLNDADYSCANGECILAVDYTTDQLFCSAFGP